jgi:hypothetical protein
VILTKLTIIIIITFEIYRHLRSQEKDLLVNPGLVYDNVVHFAQTIKAIGWKGPVVFMTDCTKIRAKVMYAHELGQIVGSVLDDQDTQVSSNQGEKSCCITSPWISFKGKSEKLCILL